MNLLKIALFLGIVVLTGVVLNALKPVMPFSAGFNRVILEGGAAVIILIAFYAFMLGWDREPPKKLSIYPSKSFSRWLGVGFIVGVVMLVVTFLVIYLSGSISITPLVLSDSIYGNILLFFIASLFAAIWEEVAFRGYLLQKLSETIGIHTSCVVVALCFGLLHLVSSLSSYQIVISTFLSGMLLNYAYFYSGNIYLPLGIHFGWNSFNGLLFGGRILEVEYKNTLLAGIRNPEQGLVAILVTGLVAASLLYLYHRKEKTHV